MALPGLSTESLSKIYHGRWVVREVSLHVRAGEIVGLLGPNGAGKTTTFYMIVGLLRPHSGAVYLDGRALTHLPMHRRARLGIGYLPQEASIFRNLTVAQNILAVLETLPISRRDRLEKVDRLLEDFALQALRDAKGHVLSGGERRRVELARLLALAPQFVLLDEPFSGIDPIMVNEIQTFIFGLKQRGIGVLMTDHRVREILEITDRAYIIHAGCVLQSGAPQELVESPDVKQIYLGEGFSLPIENNEGF